MRKGIVLNGGHPSEVRQPCQRLARMGGVVGDNTVSTLRKILYDGVHFIGGPDVDARGVPSGPLDQTLLRLDSQIGRKPIRDPSAAPKEGRVDAEIAPKPSRNF